MRACTVPRAPIRCVFLALAPAWLLLSQLPLQAALPGAGEVLERYRSGLSWQEKFSLRVQTVGEWEDALQEQRPVNIPDEIAIKKDGVRWRWSTTFFEPVEQGKPFGKWKINWEQDHLVTTLDEGSYYFVQAVNAPGPGRHAVYCYPQDDMKEARVQLGNAGGEGVFGWFREVGFIPLTDLLPANATQVAEEERNGIPCVTLSSETKYARTKVWLDPSKGYALVGCTVEVESGKHFYPAALPGDEYKKPLARDREGNEHTIELTRQELTRVEFLEIDGHYVPKASEVIRTSYLDDGSVMTRKDVYRITEIELNPSFAPDTFEPSFGEGRELLCFGPAKELLTGFEWKGGKIVPRISENELNRLKDEVASAKDSDSSGVDSATPAKALRVKAEKNEPPSANLARYGYFLAVFVLGLTLLIFLLYVSRGKKA